MKVLLTILLVSLLVPQAVAGGMLERKTIELGGSGYYEERRHDDNQFAEEKTTRTGLQIDPGIFLLDGLSFGLLLSIDHADYNFSRSQSTQVGPRLTYYPLPSENGSPFVKVSFMQGDYDSESDYGYEYNRSTATFLAGIGFLFPLTRFVGLSAEVDYRTTSTDYKYSNDQSRQSERRAGHRWQFALGFRLFHYSE